MRGAYNSDNFKFGLLHFVHLLVTVDGYIDDRERATILSIKEEEQISDSMFRDFELKAKTCDEQQIYFEGNELLSACTDDERLAAFVHLYKLAEADASVNIKEVRLLLYGLKVNKVSFEDVMLIAKMVGK